MSPPHPTPDVKARIRAEYREMPGLQLTLAQARRLFALDAVQCAQLFEVLEREGFLKRTRRGLFILARDTQTRYGAAS